MLLCSPVGDFRDICIKDLARWFGVRKEKIKRTVGGRFSAATALQLQSPKNGLAYKVL